jgi:hypothetical protein
MLRADIRSRRAFIFFLTASDHTRELPMPKFLHSLPFTGPAAVLIAAAIMSLAGCAAEKAPPTVLPDAVKLRTLAVMPTIDMYRIYGDNVSFNCPLCGRTQLIDVVSKDADTFLTQAVFSRLQQRGGYRLIPPGEVEGVQSTMLLDPEQNAADLGMIMEIGRRLEADGVVLGRVYRFRERIGRDYSAETSAAVTFDLLLIQVPQGRLLWEGQFNESQQPLTENLFNIGAFFQRKGRWLTARELAESGLDDVLASFPDPK